MGRLQGGRDHGGVEEASDRVDGAGGKSSFSKHQVNCLRPHGNYSCQESISRSRGCKLSQGSWAQNGNTDSIYTKSRKRQTDLGVEVRTSALGGGACGGPGGSRRETSSGLLGLYMAHVHFVKMHEAGHLSAHMLR